ncbi:hypothetical protein SDRG_15327 [Saprolegnia diclina VS20]|uniref:Pectinesterase inhibitor domain-containing protein n=1 Tax=Saprolegnia diclina (strain VS20) TaxID=1156394 RepID=T0Q0C4_SAPDV|nr:hypothetical protein SDRG_15327 [Saprolegnia diclina VS20]EQC26815.1 hypothetical protein SDRG_15327 [Saprolegnia diclina VS20]|eukprot:XP_008619717.1 hypothetical protein SDRG_15327 [Saprolegnia diclina VS20]
MARRLVLLSSLYLATAVLGRCYCGVPAACNDLEAQSECNRANDQVTDMVNSAGRNADLYLEGLLFKNASVTPSQTSYLRSKLSEAFEWGKPVGDCSDGLTTSTHLANAVDICFSIPLFQQCDTLAKSVPQYFNNIHNVLSERLLNSSVSGILEKGKLTTLATELVQVMKVRSSIARESNKIRCKGYNATTEILLRPSSAWTSPLSFVAVTMLALLV